MVAYIEARSAEAKLKDANQRLQAQEAYLAKFALSSAWIKAPGFVESSFI